MPSRLISLRPGARSVRRPIDRTRRPYRCPRQQRRDLAGGAGLDFDTERFRYELEIDLVAPFALARDVARDAIANRLPASIVNIGSILGQVAGGKLRVPGYSAAKGGLHNLTRELASQWGRKGVRVNAIAPGWFETEMNDAMFDDAGGRAYMEAGAVMGRPGRDGELDGAFLFLASDASTFVTGHVLAVDGGWTAS